MSGTPVKLPPYLKALGLQQYEAAFAAAHHFYVNNVAGCSTEQLLQLGMAPDHAALLRVQLDALLRAGSVPTDPPAATSAGISLFLGNEWYWAQPRDAAADRKILAGMTSGPAASVKLWQYLEALGLKRHVNTLETRAQYFTLRDVAGASTEQLVRLGMSPDEVSLLYAQLDALPDLGAAPAPPPPDTSGISIHIGSKWYKAELQTAGCGETVATPRPEDGHHSVPIPTPRHVHTPPPESCPGLTPRRTASTATPRPCHTPRPESCPGLTPRRAVCSQQGCMYGVKGLPREPLFSESCGHTTVPADADSRTPRSAAAPYTPRPVASAVLHVLETMRPVLVDPVGELAGTPPVADAAALVGAGPSPRSESEDTSPSTRCAGGALAASDGSDATVTQPPADDLQISSQHFDRDGLFEVRIRCGGDNVWRPARVTNHGAVPGTFDVVSEQYDPVLQRSRRTEHVSGRRSIRWAAMTA